MSWMYEPRPSRNWDEDDEGGREPVGPLSVLAAIVLLPILAVAGFICVVVGIIYAEFIGPASAPKPDGSRRSILPYVVSGVMIALLIAWWVGSSFAPRHAAPPSLMHAATSTPAPKATAAPPKTRRPAPTPLIPAALLPTQTPGLPPQDWAALTNPAGIAAGIEKCAGKLLYQWASPKSTQAPVLAPCADMSRDWVYGKQSFGAHMPEPPIIGRGANLTCGGRATLVLSPVVEKVETARGVFEALRVDAEQGSEQYGVWHHYRGWIKHIANIYRASEWWVCGLGLVRVSASYEYDDGVCTPTKTHADVSLLP